MTYMKYLEQVRKTAVKVIDPETREMAAVEIMREMKNQQSGFNEHTVVDLMLMAYHIGENMGEKDDA